jgi:chromosome segregation ATPase
MQEHRARAAARRIKGVVADIVRRPRAGDRRRGGAGRALGNVIVDSHEAGVEAIQFLKRTREGRSSFIPRARAPQASRGEVVYRREPAGVESDVVRSRPVPRR